MQEVKKGFCHLSEAWYGPANLEYRKHLIDQIMIGYYNEDGEQFGEFAINWKELCGDEAAKLQVFDDQWNILPRFSELFEKLSKFEDQTPTPDDIVSMLENLGYEDRTPYVKNKPE